MTPTFDLAATLARYRYVYVTVGEDRLGAYRGNRDAAMRDASRMCRKSDMPVRFFEDGRQIGQFTPVLGRAMWTAEEGRAA